MAKGIWNRCIISDHWWHQKKLDKHLKEYLNKVQKDHRSKRKNMIKWKSENNILLDILVKDVNIKQWEDAEKLFFKD